VQLVEDVHPTMLSLDGIRIRVGTKNAWVLESKKEPRVCAIPKQSRDRPLGKCRQPYGPFNYLDLPEGRFVASGNRRKATPALTTF